MINKNGVMCESNLLPHQLIRLSWSAIFAGALVILGLGFLLNLFGLAIGLTAVTLSKDGANVMAIGGLIGILIGVIASMLVAGYASGYLGRLYCPNRNLGILYGFTTWSLGLILSAAVAVPLSSYVSAYTTTISHSTLVVTGTNKTGAVAVESTPSSENKNQQNIKVSASPSSLAGAAFIVFALFFIGAFFTCIGACWGMSCKRED